MHNKRHTRIDQLKSVAFYQEMEFSEKDEFRMISYLRPFRLFNRGFGKKISNILIGKEPLLEGQIRSFDYQYTINTGNYSKTIRQTVFWANSKSLGIPPFRMQPEKLFHRIGTWLGMQDIDFETYPEFSRKYLLKSRDEESVKAFFTDEVLSFFSEEHGWYLEALNYYFIIYKSQHLVPSEDYPDFLSKSKEVYHLFRDISQQLYGYQEAIRYKRLLEEEEE